MTFEVELKFPLQDSHEVLLRLSNLGAVTDSAIEQSDRYFNHPARDFSVTDEAFRIRSVGSANFVTYKGPIVDRETKMRREIEIAIADGPEAAEQMAELWTALGFRFVHEVRKTRTPGRVTWNNRQYELALDQVPPLGTFLEIELVVDDSEREAAKQAILNLARELNLKNPERRSYLQLVMEERLRAKG